MSQKKKTKTTNLYSWADKETRLRVDGEGTGKRAKFSSHLLQILLFFAQFLKKTAQDSLWIFWGDDIRKFLPKKVVEKVHSQNVWNCIHPLGQRSV